MIKKIQNRLLNVIDNLSWGRYGKGSKVIRPMRLLGKKRIFLGDNVIILNQARMETLRGWGENSLDGKLIIGNGTSFEQCCHLIAADKVEIGKACVFSAFVYVSDCSHGYTPDEDIMKSELDIKPVKIGNHCFVGIGSCIMPGVTIGNNVVIGANSVVTSDVADYCMVAGAPAKVIKVYNIEQKRWEKV